MPAGERAGRWFGGPGGKRLKARGADWLWRKLADRQGKPVGDVQAETPAIEFLRWRLFYQQEEEEDFERRWAQHREDFYLAQVAYEVYALRVRVTSLVDKKTARAEGDRQFKDFLYDFLQHFKPKAGGLSEEEKKDRAFWEANARAKQRWFGRLGMGPPPAE